VPGSLRKSFDLEIVRYYGKITLLGRAPNCTPFL